MASPKRALILCRASSPQLPNIISLSAPQTQRSGATSGWDHLLAMHLPRPVWPVSKPLAIAC